MTSPTAPAGFRGHRDGWRSSTRARECVRRERTRDWRSVWMISFSSRAVSHRKFERTYRARCSTSSTRSRRESP